MCFFEQISGNERFMKNTRFYHFFMTAPKKISSGRRSDNIEVWWLAHSSFRNWCSTFFKTHAGNSDTFKFWVPAHSKVSWSRTMTAKMSVFRPLFWRKSLFWPIPTKWTPPSVIHGWKATDLLFLIVKRKKYFLNPISRQNFAYAFAETPNLNLEVRHIWLFCSSDK